MEQAKKALEEWGYGEFKNTSASKPYDYTCLRNGNLFYVEVKGTQTIGKTLILTRNEVEHVSANPNASILVLVHTIKVTPKSPYKAKGGTVEIRERWQFTKGDLTPIQYAFRT